MLISLAVAKSRSSSQQGFTFRSSVAMKLWFLQNQTAIRLILPNVLPPSSADEIQVKISIVEETLDLRFYLLFYNGTNKK